MKQGWEYKKLGDCTQILDSQRKPVTKKDRIGGIYPYYGATGIQDYVDKYIFDGRYVLVGEDGAKWSAFEQSAFIIEGKSWVNNHAHVLKPHDLLVDTFLIYFLNYSDLDSYISGAIVRKLTQVSLRNIDIPLPPKSTQLTIVSELDKINELIRLKKEQLKDYDNLAQSIFYEMFGDPVENDKGWEVKKLGEVGQIVTGTTPSTNEESNWNGNINWVTPAELGTQLYYGETIRRISTNAAKKLTLMPVGTVLLSTRAPIGKLAITKVPMCCNQGFKNIICCQDLNNIFLYFYLLLTMYKIKAMGRGATFKEVSKQAISHYLVLLPPLPLQQLFAQRIEQIERQKSAVQKLITDLETLLASRMQHWFE